MVITAPRAGFAEIANTFDIPYLQQQSPLSSRDWGRNDVGLWRNWGGNSFGFQDWIAMRYRTECYNRGGNSQYPGVPIIGDNVYISHGAIVFGGITIGNNVIIGANAVVNKPVPDNAVVAGVPARVLRIREMEKV